MNQYKDTSKRTDAPQQADNGQNERDNFSRVQAVLDVVFLVAVILAIFALAISCQPAHGNRLTAQALHEHGQAWQNLAIT